MQNKLYSQQRLKDYALWYYFRYYPSNAKLLRKLQEKGSIEDSKKVFGEIEHLLQEDEIISAKIENYIFRNKNYRYIEQKMAEKLFPRGKIQSYLLKYKKSGKILRSEAYIEKQVLLMMQKGKSQKEIMQKLGETSQDRELVNMLLQTHYLEENIEESLQIQLKRMNASLSKEKKIQRLMQKGFHYGDIKKALEGFES